VNSTIHRPSPFLCVVNDGTRLPRIDRGRAPNRINASAPALLGNDNLSFIDGNSRQQPMAICSAAML
jgi:hypothetical protein